MLLPRVDGPLGPIAYMWILGFFVDGNENQGENNSRNRIRNGINALSGVALERA